MKKAKKIFVLLLAFVMVLSVLPMTVLEASAQVSRASAFAPATYSSDPGTYMANIAAAQVGKTRYDLGYSSDLNYGWCDDFISDCAIVAGQAAAVPMGSTVGDFLNKLKSAGASQVYSPKAGDIAIFGTYHCAVCLDGTWCVDGNNVYDYSYGSVRKSQYSYFSDVTYWRPAYKAAHTHSYDTYVYYWETHPHYKCYQCSCGEVKENVNEPVFIETCEECINSVRPAKPALLDMKASYTEGEDTIFKWNSVAKANKYDIIIKCFNGQSYEVYETISNAASGAYRKLPAGTYQAVLKAINTDYKELNSTEYLSTVSDAADFTVSAFSHNSTEFSEWVTSLPAEVTEEKYEIESQKMYRYRDNTNETQYGAWSGNQTTGSRPTESDVLRITGITTYYNYYHYCCNDYDGQHNVDSVICGSGAHHYHSVQLTYELPYHAEWADQGGQPQFGGQGVAPACPCNFYAWVKANPYVTYQYTYQTRTKSEVTKEGTWSEWQSTKPTEKTNRDIEEITFYRYKLKSGVSFSLTPDRTKAAAGNIITYTAKMSPVSMLWGVKLKLKLPETLEFVSGSAASTLR